MFGAARPLDDSYIPYGSNRPVHRGGGLATFSGGTEISFGRTAYVNLIDGSDGERIHESYHYYQQIKMGLLIYMVVLFLNNYVLFLLLKIEPM